MIKKLYHSNRQYSIIKDRNANGRIWTHKPFLTDDFQDRSLYRSGTLAILYAHISLSVSVAISLFNDCLTRLSPIHFSQNIDHLLADSVIWPNNCRNRYYAAVSQHLRTGTSVMIFCCLSVGCLPAVYLTCTFTKHLVPPPYLTLYFISAKWGRKELNLQCLPRGNGFTVRCNTANRCRFPEMRGHLTPYLCMRLRYAYSIRSARHHRNGRIRTFNPALVVVFRVHATFTN